MRAWRFHETGKLESLRVDEVARPEPGEGEALVRVLYAALNPADHYLILGQYPRSAPPPFTVGRDACGIVEQAPAGASIAEGDKVVLLRSDVGISRPGTLAEYFTAPVDALGMLPEGWTAEEGAAGPLVLLTAWQALVDRGGLKPGETVLITGASGGVGSAAILLASALGARVVALSRSREKWDALKTLGAEVVLDTAANDLEKQVKAALGGGADLIIDNLGGPYLERCVRMANPEGRVMVVGLLAGLKAEVTIGLLIHKCVRIQGLSVSSYTEAESQHAWNRIVETLSQSGKRPLIDRVFPFEELPEAFARLNEGPLGKVLLRAPAE